MILVSSSWIVKNKYLYTIWSPSLLHKPSLPGRMFPVHVSLGSKCRKGIERERYVSDPPQLRFSRLSAIYRPTYGLKVCVGLCGGPFWQWKAQTEVGNKNTRGLIQLPGEELGSIWAGAYSPTCLFHVTPDVNWLSRGTIYQLKARNVSWGYCKIIYHMIYIQQAHLFQAAQHTVQWKLTFKALTVNGAYGLPWKHFIFPLWRSQC